MGQVDLSSPSKDETGYIATPEIELLTTTIERDWTVEEEKKAKRKYGVAFLIRRCRRLTVSLGLTY
jgi:transposase